MIAVRIPAGTTVHHVSTGRTIGHDHPARTFADDHPELELCRAADPDLFFQRTRQDQR